MPIVVDYSPPAGLIGAAAREVGGAQQLSQNAALRSQQLGQLLQAYGQQQSVAQHADAAELHAAAQSEATQTRRVMAQENDYSQLALLGQQQRHQADQSQQQFGQRAWIEQQRQQGMGDRTQARIDAHAELQSQRLSAAETRQMGELENSLAHIDQRVAAGEFTQEEGEVLRRQVLPQLQGFRQRQSRSQAAGMAITQQQQAEEATRQGALAIQNFQARIPRNPDGTAMFVHPESGAPMYLDHRGDPKPLWESARPAVSFADFSRMRADMRAAMTTTTGTGEARRTSAPSEEALDEAVNQSLHQYQQFVEGQRRSQVNRPAGAPGQQGAQQQLGTPEQPHREYNVAEQTPRFNALLSQVPQVRGIEGRQLQMNILMAQQLLQTYGRFENMPGEQQQLYVTHMQNIQRLRPRGTAAPAPAEPPPVFNPDEHN